MDTSQLRREAEEAEAKAAAARDKVYQYNLALARAGEATDGKCGKCRHYWYSPEFGYSYCDQLGDVSGNYRSWDSIASFDKAGHFQCERFEKR